jgi:protein transport protein SEC24
MLKAVMHMCATRGIRMPSFYGSFFVRSTDLLAMPAVPQDMSYAIEFQIEESIKSLFVVFQTAILHTTCYGQYYILFTSV